MVLSCSKCGVIPEGKWEIKWKCIDCGHKMGGHILLKAPQHMGHDIELTLEIDE